MLLAIYCNPRQEVRVILFLYARFVIGYFILLSAQGEIFLQSVASQKSPYNKLATGWKTKDH